MVRTSVINNEVHLDSSMGVAHRSCTLRRPRAAAAVPAAGAQDRQQGGSHSSCLVTGRIGGVGAVDKGAAVCAQVEAAGHGSILRARTGSARLCWCWRLLRASLCRLRGVRHRRPLLRQAPLI